MLRTWLFALCVFTLPLIGEDTLAMIKPDAVKDNHIGDIIALFEKNGLEVAALKMQKWNKQEAEAFYAIHKDRPFFKDLVAYMTSGPTVAIVLKGDNAVERARKVIGATNPANAEAGTVRKLFGKSITQNAIHGSDSAENAQKEMGFFFAKEELAR